MLYEVQGGGFLGFYREYGGSVSIVGERTQYNREWIVKPRPVDKFIPEHYEDREFWQAELTVDEWVLVPEHVVIETRTVEAGWEYSQIFVPGAWLDRRYWIEENCEYQRVTELRNILGVMKTVTRTILVCEPAHWGSRKEWVPGWWKEVSVWVDEHEEQYEVKVRTQYVKQPVTHPGYFYNKSVLVPARTVVEWVESGAFEDVPYQQLIYGYSGNSEEYALEELQRFAGEPRPGVNPYDSMQLRYTGTNNWISLNAGFISNATSIGYNRYVA